MEKRKGEIATVLAIGTMIVIAVSTFVSSNFLKNKQTTNTNAQELGPQVTCQHNPWKEKSPTNYCWFTDCKKSCVTNADCPMSPSGYVRPETSNWCYAFLENGQATKRCMMLVYKDDAKYAECNKGGVPSTGGSGAGAGTGVGAGAGGVVPPAAATATKAPAAPNKAPTSTLTPTPTINNISACGSYYLDQCSFDYDCQNAVPCINNHNNNQPCSCGSFVAPTIPPISTPTKTPTPTITPTPKILSSSPSPNQIIYNNDKCKIELNSSVECPVNQSISEIKMPVEIEFTVAKYSCLGFVNDNLACQLANLDLLDTWLFLSDTESFNINNQVQQLLISRGDAIGRGFWRLDSTYKMSFSFKCKRGESIMYKYLWDKKNNKIIDITNVVRYERCEEL